MNLDRLISCPNHGSTEWQGHLVCPDCNLTFHIHIVDDDSCDCAYEAPDDCECGLDLKERGRAICAGCFDISKMSMVRGGDA